MKNKKQFTLIELIIVIVVIGILSAIALPKFNGVVRNARLGAMINDKEVLEKTLILYYQKYDRLPLLSDNQELIVLNNDISLIKMVQAEEIQNNDMKTIYTSLQETLKHYNDDEENLYRIDVSKVKDSLSKKLKYGYKKEDKDFYVYSTKTNNVYYYDIMLNGEGEIQHSEFNTKLKTSGLIERKNDSNNLDKSDNEDIDIKVFNDNIIALGYGHSIKLSTNGDVYSWGNNSYGQLGIENTINQTIPQKVIFPTNENIKSIYAGFYHSIALTMEGNLYSWGQNNFGQLGIGNTINQNTPQKVSIPNNEKVVFVSLSYGYSMIITTSGKLYSFGLNNYGQLGVGNNKNQTTPQLVTLPNGVKPISISLGAYHSAAICDDNNLYTWGESVDGQLGIGNTINKNTPQLVLFPNIVKPIEVALGQDHSIVLCDNGDIYSFGNSTYGELGFSNIYSLNLPKKIEFENDLKFKFIKVVGHSCFALGNDNNLYSWGLNEFGQLGLGDVTNRKTPTKISFFENNELKNIYVGNHYSIIQLKNNEYYAWGQNEYGQLGLKNTINQSMPTKTELP